MQSMFRYILHFTMPLLLAALSIQEANSQEIDSLRQVLAGATSDSARVMILLDLGYVYEFSDQDSAIAIYDRASNISKNAGFTIGQAKATQYKGIVYTDKGDYLQSILQYNKALKLYQSIANDNGIATTYNNLGNSYLFLGDFKEAVRFYLLARPMFEKAERKDQLVVLYGNMGDCYRQLKEYPAMLEVARKSYKNAVQINDPKEIANSGITLGTALSLNGQADSAQYFLQESLRMGREMDDPSIQYYSLMDLTNEDLKKGDSKSALLKADSVMIMAEREQKSYHIIAAHNLRGACLDAQGKNKEALFAFSTALNLARQDSSIKLIQESLEYLYEFHLNRGNFKEALSYRDQWVEVNEDLFNAEKSKQIALFRTVFETAEKDKLLVEEKEKGLVKDEKIRKRNQYLLLAGIGIVLIGVLSFLLLRIQRTKRKVAEQEALLEQEKNKALEKEKDAVQLRSLIEGQEQERQRLGRELHDGLGGMLTAARMQLEQLGKESGAGMPVDKYLTLQNLITRTSKEMRDMSHNLAPEGLDKVGLSESLRTYCQRVSSPTLVISFESYGEIWSSGIANDAAIFRMVQELINNAQKHADAKETFVSLNYLPDSIALTVEDNGKGFDTTKSFISSKGIESMKARVTYLKGQIEWLSSPGKGTSVNIIIPRHG
jgi:signal transduction histidine kinase